MRSLAVEAKCRFEHSTVRCGYCIQCDKTGVNFQSFYWVYSDQHCGAWRLHLTAAMNYCIGEANTPKTFSFLGSSKGCLITPWSENWGIIRFGFYFSADWHVSNGQWGGSWASGCPRYCQNPRRLIIDRGNLLRAAGGQKTRLAPPCCDRWFKWCTIRLTRPRTYKFNLLEIEVVDACLIMFASIHCCQLFRSVDLLLLVPRFWAI